MHPFLEGLIGNAFSVLVGGLAWIVAKHRRHAPGFGVDDWLFALAVAMMLLAGELAATTGAGRWVTRLVSQVAGYLGEAGLVIVGLVALFLLVKCVIAVLRKDGGDKMLIFAFVLPLLLAMFPTGVFHQLSVALQGPANSLALTIAHAMGV